MTQYDSARARFADWGVDTEAAIAATLAVPISVHCWQGDDVGGFERKSGSAGGVFSLDQILVHHAHRVKACTLPASTFRIFPVDLADRSEAKK